MLPNLDILKRFYVVLSGLVFIILAGRLAQLQLYHWDVYFSESEENRVREIIVDAPRGQIFDRHGKILVDNRPSYSVSVIPYEFLKSDTAIKLLSSFVQQPRASLLKRIESDKISNFNPVRIKRQIGFETLSNLEEHRLDLPGVFHAMESKRHYPGGVRAPQVFGYLDEILPSELEAVRGAGYRPGDSMGRTGIEMVYETYLRGKSSVKYVEVDVLGREVRELPDLSRSSPKPGKDLYMTIDADLQRFAEERMTDLKGGVVAIDPRNGDVLTFVSSPDYDPELFSDPLTPEVWNSLVNDGNHPLYNRASQSLFPPGSTFKLVLVAAGLETGLIDTSEQVFCSGSYRFGRRQFHCWKLEGHGAVNLRQAIRQSCNVFFYKKGLDVGLNKWSEFGAYFHFGKKTGIDLANETAGLLPDRAYLDSRYGKNGWTRGLVLNLSVGQGDLLTTPLQMANFVVILANAGKGYRPRLVKRIVDSSTNQSIDLQSESFQVKQVSARTFSLIRQGMYEVVNHPHGTGQAARVAGVNVCGKTGTAQNPHGKSHAWFIGFAPMENPEIAICVMVENGGGGSAVAAPIVGALLRKFFAARNKEIARANRQ